jgi:hypothetical protein
MTKPPFPDWAPREIARLRQEADALQRALDLYLGRPSGAGVFDGPKLVHTNDGSRSKISKYEPMFKAFEAAGRVLTLDDMLNIAQQAGFSLNRANLRSQVFVQKTLGRARVEGNGYVWQLSKIETALPEEKSAVS